jgi:hypothetical protein
MGYTVAVHAKNKNLLCDMWVFMQEYYTKPSALFGRKNDYSRLSVNINKEPGLSYDHSKLAIGFDYNAVGPERDYIFSIIRWMTIKIGKTKRLKAIGDVPYYVYDGYDKCLVIVGDFYNENIPEEYKHCVVDSYGYQTFASQYFGVPAYEEAPDKNIWIQEKLSAYATLAGIPASIVEEKIKNELIRLEALYTKKY